MRVLALVAYRPALVYYGDSYFYLLNARPIRPDSYHPAGYSAFLRLFSGRGGLVAVVVVQHLVWLALGVVTYRFLVARRVRPWVAALATFPILLDGYQILVEHMVMAEAVANALSLAVLLFLAGRRRPAVSLVAAAGMLALACLTRTVSVVLLVPAVLLVRRDRGDWRRALAMVGATALFLVPYAAWHATVSQGFAIDDKTGLLLYGRTAPIADCAARALGDGAVARLCPADVPVPERPGPTYYLWATGSPLRTHYAPDGYDVGDAPVGEFARRVVTHQPFDYLALVARDTARYVKPYRTTGPADGPVRDWQFPTATPWTPTVGVAYQGYPVAGPATLGRATPHLSPGAARWLHRYQRYVYLPGPVLLAALAVAAWGAVRGSSRRLVVAFGSAAVGTLLAASAVVQFDYRFLLGPQVFLCVAAALAVPLRRDEEAGQAG